MDDVSPTTKKKCQIEESYKNSATNRCRRGSRGPACIAKVWFKRASTILLCISPLEGNAHLPITILLGAATASRCIGTQCCMCIQVRSFTKTHYSTYVHSSIEQLLLFAVLLGVRGLQTTHAQARVYLISLANTAKKRQGRNLTSMTRKKKIMRGTRACDQMHMYNFRNLDGWGRGRQAFPLSHHPGSTARPQGGEP